MYNAAQVKVLTKIINGKIDRKLQSLKGPERTAYEDKTKDAFKKKHARLIAEIEKKGKQLNIEAKKVGLEIGSSLQKIYINACYNNRPFQKQIDQLESLKDILTLEILDTEGDITTIMKSIDKRITDTCK